jgi:hypothetical protein
MTALASSRSKIPLAATAFFALSCGMAALAQISPVTIVVGEAAGYPGSEVRIPISVKASGNQVVAVNIDVAIGDGVSVVYDSETGAKCETALKGLDNVGALYRLMPPGCAPHARCDGLASVVTTAGLGPIDGLAYTCSLKISTDALAGRRSVECLRSEAADSFGSGLAVECASGVVSVVSCLGDCSFDDVVDIAELVDGVSSAVTGRVPCAAWDSDGDGRIPISDLVFGVTNSLEGCGREEFQ